MPGPEDLAESLALHAFEVEKTEKRGKDTVLDVEMTANRAADASSHLGLSRECAAVLDLGLKLPESVSDLDRDEDSSIEVEVLENGLCSRYLAAEMRGVEVRSSPEWMKKRLLACGLQPINNVVDALNYVMLETGQPLHAFDASRLERGKILVRKAEEGEAVNTLDGRKVVLSSEDLVIADGRKAVGIAGIKGGEETGVEKETERVVVEAARFDPVSVRRTSQRVKIKTDASYRFEHGLDPNLAEKGLKRAVFLLKELASAELVASRDFYPDPVGPRRLRLRPVELEKLLGIRIKEEKILTILDSLGFEVEDEKEGEIRVRVPTRRRDVRREQDVIEEVGRIYGYDKIPTRMPESVLVPPEKNLSLFWEESAKDALKEAGMAEVYNYSFISGEQASLFRFEKERLVEVANPLSERYKFLAPSLLPRLVQNARLNLKYFDRFRIFELGKVFERKERGGVLEKRRLAGLFVGEEGGEKLFFEAKGVVNGLFSKMGLTDLWYDDFEPRPEGAGGEVWEKGRAAEIQFREEEVGYLGFLSRCLLEAGGEIVAFDLDFEKVGRAASEETEFEPISPYPKAKRDLAVLVPGEVKTAAVLNVVNRAGGVLVRDVDLFDVYAGEELPGGKKNFAFHLVYQAEDRTLEAQEIEELHRKIIAALEEKGWEVRK